MSGGEILLSAIAAALVVVSGALYALFFALGRLAGRLSLGRLAWVAYGALVICTVLLVRAMNLSGGWLAVVAVMLLGYLLAPHAIWHLSVATHLEPDEPGDRTGAAEGEAWR